MLGENRQITLGCKVDMKIKPFANFAYCDCCNLERTCVTLWDEPESCEVGTFCLRCLDAFADVLKEELLEK